MQMLPKKKVQLRFDYVGSYIHSFIHLISTPPFTPKGVPSLRAKLHPGCDPPTACGHKQKSPSSPVFRFIYLTFKL